MLKPLGLFSNKKDTEPDKPLTTLTNYQVPRSFINFDKDCYPKYKGVQKLW
jgi:hypothetical protein